MHSSVIWLPFGNSSCSQEGASHEAASSSCESALWGGVGGEGFCRAGSGEAAPGCLFRAHRAGVRSGTGAENFLNVSPAVQCDRSARSLVGGKPPVKRLLDQMLATRPSFAK